MIGWLANNWFAFVFPLLIVLAAAVIGLVTRILLYRVARKAWWHGKTSTSIQHIVEAVLWHPIIHWFLMLGAYVSVQFSVLSPAAKNVASKGLETLFVLSLLWVSITLSTRLIRFYLSKASQSLVLLALNLVRVTITFIALLTLLDIWGAPTQPAIIVLVTALFVGGLSLRDTINNLLAGLEIVYSEQIKVGHFLKLDSGEAGYVTHLSLTKTTISATGGSQVIVPNSKLAHSVLVNYGASPPVDSTPATPREPVATQPVKLDDTLSDREREVLRLIGKGATNREIAQELFISEHTVKTHLRSILSKLNIRNRQQAAAYAMQVGLMSDTKVIEGKPPTTT
jgi:DNA-binding CsgD family transcriptional regulator